MENRSVLSRYLINCTIFPGIVGLRSLSTPYEGGIVFHLGWTLGSLIY